MVKELPVSNQIDQKGGYLTIPPLPQDVGTWKGLEGMDNKDIELSEGQQEDQSDSLRFWQREEDTEGKRNSTRKCSKAPMTLNGR